MTKLINERFVFGCIIILGYFITGWLSSAGVITEDPAAQGTIRDMLVSVGPLLGMIVQALFKSDRKEDTQADTINTLANRVAPQMPVRGVVDFAQGEQDARNNQSDQEADSLAASGTQVGAPGWRRLDPNK